MLTAICAMIVNEYLHNVNISIIEASIFIGFTVFAVICLILLIKSVRETTDNS